MFDHFVDTRRYRVKNCHGKSIKIAWLCFFSKFPLLLIMNISGLADFGGPCYTYTTWNLYRQVWKFPLFRKLRGKQVLFLYRRCDTKHSNKEANIYPTVFKTSLKRRSCQNFISHQIDVLINEEVFLSLQMK